MKKKLIVLVISLVFIPLIAAGGFFYYWVFGQIALPPLVRGIIVFTTLALIGVFIAVMVQRLKEIKQEDEDDLSKY
jgi:uncharacterized membrane protein